MGIKIIWWAGFGFMVGLFCGWVIISYLERYLDEN